MSNLSTVLCKIGIIRTLIEGERIGVRDLSKFTKTSINITKKAIEDLNSQNKFGNAGLLKKKRGKYELVLYDKESSKAKILAEIIGDVLEINRALKPQDLADKVKEITNNKFGQKEILDVAKWLNEKKMFGVLKKTLYKNVKGQYWSRSVFCNERYKDMLDYDTIIKPKVKKTEVKLEESKEGFERYRDFIEHLKSLKDYKGQIIHIEQPKIEDARYGELDSSLDTRIIEFLKRKKSHLFYTHQASAIDSIRAGKNVLVTTPNASGKTLCYLVPVFEEILKSSISTFLYISPTKALAQDQLKRFIEFDNFLYTNTVPSTFDGDTKKENQQEIESLSRIILTNPDKIHVSMLPFHYKWKRFFRNLKYIIIDEMHIYKGIFGSHVANVIRRLRRICNHYGSNPKFIGVSATISNPEEFVEKLCGLKFILINNNGAPIWPKYFIFWNPPLDESGRRLSPYTEASLLFKEHVKHNLQNITFTQARKITELLLKKTKEVLSEDLRERIASYRAGYTPEKRREIENGLKSGELVGVTSTNALELGVDIGNLDATILLGYPGSIASTWQQANRAGRRDKEALVTLIALDDPLNQYLITHPQDFFSKPNESAIIDPDNMYVFADHVVCAASELPLSEGEVVFGKKLKNYLLSIPEPEFYQDKEFCPKCGKLIKFNLNEKGVYCDNCYSDPLIKKGDGWISLIRRPYMNTYIRGSASWQDNIKIKDVNTLEEIGDSNKNRAIKELHDGAVYLSQGKNYLVNELDLNNKVAFVQYTPRIDYHTESLRSIKIIVKNVHENKEINSINVENGGLIVTETVTGFVKISEDEKGEEAVKDEIYLEPNTNKMETFGMWIEFPDALKNDLKISNEEFEAGLHAIEHLMGNLLPKFAICDRRDINTVSLGSRIYIYDNILGGVGLSEKGYQLIKDLLSLSYEVVKDCKCKNEDGCPSCIQSSFCEKRNRNLNKELAIKILQNITQINKVKNENKPR